MSKCWREKVGEMNVVEGERERSDIFQVSCSLHTIFITWFCGILLNNKTQAKLRREWKQFDGNLKFLFFSIP
jgi:hypothetical protein